MLYGVILEKYCLWGLCIKVGASHKVDHPTSKVFRQTYVSNHEIKKLNFIERYVPATFRNYHVKDVKEEYYVPCRCGNQIKRNKKRSMCAVD